MGYACPVCGDPQVDARHLANHLAFTAMLGREDHEAWLDEHAPGWAEEGERELADRVADLADDAEYPQVFEDTTGQLDAESDDHERSGKLFEHEGHGHDHDNDHLQSGHDHGQGHPHAQTDVPRDPETQEVLEEARELTREMLEEDSTDDGDADLDEQ